MNKAKEEGSGILPNLTPTNFMSLEKSFHIPDSRFLVITSGIETFY